MEKNQTYKAEITGYNSDGYGLCRLDNIVCFVKGSVRGDICLVRIVKVLKNVCYGIIDTMISPSPYRIEPPCPHFPKCGGCDFHNMTYEEELYFKKDKVKTALLRIAGIDTDLEIYKSPSLYHYRNKAQYPVGTLDGRTVTGFYRSRSHDIVPMEGCLLQKEIANAIAVFICRWCDINAVEIYDEDKHSGSLRHIYIRTSKDSLQLCLVSAQKNIKAQNLLVSELTQQFPQITSIILNYNPQRTNAILGDENHTLYGSDSWHDTLCENIFDISPLAFYQVNKEQAENLYDRALEYADIGSEDIVLDIYCGIGTITLHMAKRANMAYGIEIVPQAVENAKHNALINNANNVSFICADAQKGVKLFSQMGIKPSVILVDPPRKGMDSDTVNAILALSPKRLVYISCDCSTMARDIKIISQNGYTLEKVSAYDMFPRTSHVETCVLLSHKNS